MPTITLQHCVPVVIYDKFPGELTLELAVGGAPGDGTVDVTSAPNPADPPSRPTGDSGIHVAPVCGHLALHYRSATGTGSVSVTYTLTVA